MSRSEAVGNSAPISEKEYEDWFQKQFGGPGQFEPLSVFLAQQEQYFNNSASRLLSTVRRSAFWQTVVKELRDSHAEYSESDKTYGMLAHEQKVGELFNKSWKSVFLKSYRRNVLNNPNWPNAPASGWTSPENWFETINDIVRTTIVVRYLDGVEIAHKAVDKAAKETRAELKADFEAREEGYYALHIVATLPLALPGRDPWDLIETNVPIEIQVCTQVQEVLRALTHKFYEDRRRGNAPRNRKWQWRYNDEQFVPNYLGHILHYADGVIMSIRDKKDQEKP